MLERIESLQKNNILDDSISFVFQKLITFLIRYGDHLNPWGDIITMARAWCVLKPSARALVGLPAGKDEICFNSHRKYGTFFFSRLFVNWKMIFSEVDPKVFTQENNCRDVEQQKYQPINIVEKINSFTI